MPRDGSGVYTQPFPDVVAGTTIESAVYNGNVNDVEQDLNAARPIVAGGTGGTDVNSALDNLFAEKYKQVVTNWDTNVWRAGSFYAATSATGAAPIPGKAFAGIVYYANATDFVLEATNLTDPGGVKYIRTQTAGVWSSWATVDTSKKNYIVNGAMQVSQEWGTTALSGAGFYPVDQFGYNQVGTTGAVAYGQFATGAPSGGGRITFTVTTLDAAVAAGDYAYIVHRMEGLRVADLKFGTAQAKTVTLQFGVRAPAGTYSIVLANGNGVSPRAYVATYVIAVGEANTQVVRSVTIPGDTAGTWATDNTVGMEIRWGLMVGSSVSLTPGAWAASIPAGTSTQFNFMGGANVFHLFDVSLTEGTVAPPFVVPDYASELATCQRYFEKGSEPHLYMNAVSSLNITAAYGSLPFSVTKRAAPTIAVNAWQYFSGGSGVTILPGFSANADSMWWQITGLTNWTGWLNSTGTWTANARL